MFMPKLEQRLEHPEIQRRQTPPIPIKRNWLSIAVEVLIVIAVGQGVLGVAAYAFYSLHVM